MLLTNHRLLQFDQLRTIDGYLLTAQQLALGWVAVSEVLQMYKVHTQLNGGRMVFSKARKLIRSYRAFQKLYNLLRKPARDSNCSGGADSYLLGQAPWSM